MSNKTVPASINRVFIANRGEIARRIASTCKRMGIETAAISERGRRPLYLDGLIDCYFDVEEETTSLYLDSDRMIAVAKSCGADALHPGFGFLSENANFAAAVVKAGLTFVGPDPKAIDAMASKALARSMAKEAGVPCTEGLHGFAVPEDENGECAELEHFAEQIGFPLLIKAAMGGGGKGMRIVHRLEELKSAAIRARSEAVNSFGDGALICEQYLENPRHIEVQILGDRHGNVVAIGDRDCSLQRRHQKIIEEAPAPGLRPEVRQAIHQAATSLAKRVSYDNAGTVEFLLRTDANDKQSFYFLEMNTRLQVEHTVTEEIFGLDLVEWQLRVARGEKLSGQLLDGLTPQGHSLEVRIYAEDPLYGDLPSPGLVAAFLPFAGPGVRWEIGLESGDEITGRFDPMIAKLIATGADRPRACERMAQALRRTVFAGPSNNVPLLLFLVERSAFAEGVVGTHFLKDQRQPIVDQLSAARQRLEDLAHRVLTQLSRGTRMQDAPPDIYQQIVTSAFAATGNSLLNKDTYLEGRLPLEVTALGRFSRSRRHYEYGRGLVFDEAGKATLFWYATCDLNCASTAAARLLWVQIDEWVFHHEVLAEGWHGEGSALAGGLDVRAPVPGKVLAVKREAHSDVKQDETLFVLESMKMEFEVKAQGAGRIEQIHCQVGDQVKAGDLLASWESDRDQP